MAQAQMTTDEAAVNPISVKQKNLLTENLRSALPDMTHRTMLSHNSQHYIGVEQPETNYIFIDGEGRVTDFDAVSFFKRRDIDSPTEHHRGFVFVSNMQPLPIFNNEAVYTRKNFMRLAECFPTEFVTDLITRSIGAIVETFPEMDLANKELIHTSIVREPFKYHHLHFAIPTNLKGDLLTITFGEWVGYSEKQVLRGNVRALQPRVLGQTVTL